MTIHAGLLHGSKLSLTTRQYCMLTIEPRRTTETPRREAYLLFGKGSFLSVLVVSAETLVGHLAEDTVHIITGNHNTQCIPSVQQTTSRAVLVESYLGGRRQYLAHKTAGSSSEASRSMHDAAKLKLASERRRGALLRKQARLSQSRASTKSSSVTASPSSKGVAASWSSIAACQRKHQSDRSL
jgi:hypothetical protein